MKTKKIILTFILLILVGCVKKASIYNISYDECMKKLDNKETFVLAIVNDKDYEYESFNNNIDNIVKNYNINITYLNVNKLKKYEIINIKNKINYTTTPTLVFIDNGIEKNINNRIIGNISKERMIEIFKKALYID